MSQYANSRFGFNTISPSLEINQESLLKLNYPEEERLLKTNQNTNLAGLMTPRQRFQDTLNASNFSIDKYLEDRAKRFENFVRENSSQVAYSSNIQDQTNQSYREMIQRHSQFMKNEIGIESENEREWEAHQQIMVEGNLNNSLLTVALTAEDVESVDPRNVGRLQYFNDITFTRGSLWGRVQDAQAPSPQANEIVASNAQVLHYMALRWRGGKTGKLWKAPLESSEYLRNMFKEDPGVKAFLDTYTNISPSLLSLEASTDSPWFGKTIFDFLAEAEVPEYVDSQGNLVKWDPKIAVQEIKEKAPELAYVLFVQMGLTEEDLTRKDTSANPQMFKYFIADAIDNYAAAVIQDTFTRNYSTVDNMVFNYVGPILRDSLNSNDTLAEVGLTVAGMGITALGAALTPVGGVGAPVVVAGAATTVTGLTALALKVSKPFKVASRLSRVMQLEKFGNNLQKISRSIQKFPTINNKALKTQAYIFKTLSHVNKLAPHNLGESLLALSKGTKVGDTLFWMEDAKDLPWNQLWKAKETGKLGTVAKMFGKYTLRSMVNGAGQGAIEDGLRQWQSISAGFEENFSAKALASNMLEEGIGEIFIGGTLNAGVNWTNMTRAITQRELKVLDKLDFQLTKKLGQGAKNVALKAYKNLSPEMRRKIDIQVAVMSGLDEKTLAGMTTSDMVDLKVNAINLIYKLEDLGERTGLGNFALKKGKNSLIEDILFSLANGNESAIDEHSRMNLTKSLLSIDARTRDPVTGESTLSKEEWAIAAWRSALDSVAFSSTLNEEAKQMIILRLERDAVQHHLDKNDFEVKTIDELANLDDTRKDEILKDFAKTHRAITESVIVKVFNLDPDEEVDFSTINDGVFLTPDEVEIVKEEAEKYRQNQGVKELNVKGPGLTLKGETIKAVPQDAAALARKANQENEARLARESSIGARDLEAEIEEAKRQADLKDTGEPEVAPSEPEVVPSEPEVASSEPEVTPSEPEVAPSEPEVAPSEPEVAPSKPEVTPSVQDLKDNLEDRSAVNLENALESGIKPEVDPDEELDDSLKDFLNNVNCNIKGN
jgi:hypothetical protein